VKVQIPLMLALLSAAACAGGPSAAALTLEGEYARRLERAHTAGEIDRLNATYDEIRVLRLACGVQLRAKRAPLSCYEALRLETEWALHGSGERATLQHRLDERCRSAAQALRVPVAGDDSLPAVSAPCREEVRRARRIQAYRADDDATWSGN
jgi:hypothetical protein